MKLVPILASIVTGFAMLATVGSTSASALDFKLFGTFAPTDTNGTTGVAGGSFNGTYSYSGRTIPPDGFNKLSIFSINLLNASSVVVDTFSSNNANYVGEISGELNSNNLEFRTTDYGTVLQLAFPTDFHGTGNINQSSYFFTPQNSPPFGTNYINVASASSTSASQAVPEPLTIAGMVLGSVGLMAARFKYKKQKAFSAA
jgi:hypothetical protein